MTLRGTNLEGVNAVLFGSQPCPILEEGRNSTRIECKVPSRVRNHIFWGSSQKPMCLPMFSWPKLH